MSEYQKLGAALRWLRERRDIRQYELAEAAGITKAMLSYYENNRQRPSWETLERILEALGVTLSDLHDVLRFLAGEEDKEGVDYLKGRFKGDRKLGQECRTLDLEIYRFLGIKQPLPPEKEAVLRDALSGFQKLLRHLHHQSPPAAVKTREPKPNGESE